MKTLNQLLNGYKFVFQKKFEINYSLYEELAKGQSPKVMMISCSDSRVDPSLITHAEPGQIFAVRNIANLVPPLEMANRIDHSTPAALEYAVCTLGVKHIVIMGHSQCGGIRALLQGVKEADNFNFIADWLSIAEFAKEKTLEQFRDQSIEEQASVCEHEAMHLSLDNLMTYPWIADAVHKGDLMLHAWHFDIATGRLEESDIAWD